MMNSSPSSSARRTASWFIWHKAENPPHAQRPPGKISRRPIFTLKAHFCSYEWALGYTKNRSRSCEWGFYCFRSCEWALGYTKNRSRSCEWGFTASAAVNGALGYTKNRSYSCEWTFYVQKPAFVVANGFLYAKACFRRRGYAFLCAKNRRPATDGGFLRFSQGLTYPLCNRNSE